MSKHDESPAQPTPHAEKVRRRKRNLGLGAAGLAGAAAILAVTGRMQPRPEVEKSGNSPTEQTSRPGASDEATKRSQRQIVVDTSLSLTDAAPMESLTDENEAQADEQEDFSRPKIIKNGGWSLIVRMPAAKLLDYINPHSTTENGYWDTSYGWDSPLRKTLFIDKHDTLIGYDDDIPITEVTDLKQAVKVDDTHYYNNIFFQLIDDENFSGQAFSNLLVPVYDGGVSNETVTRLFNFATNSVANMENELSRSPLAESLQQYLEKRWADFERLFPEESQDAKLQENFHSLKTSLDELIVANDTLTAGEDHNEKKEQALNRVIAFTRDMLTTVIAHYAMQNKHYYRHQNAASDSARSR